MGSSPDSGKDWVAVILAIGIASAINCVTFAVLYDAIASEGPGLSDNATQILTTAFSGIVGVLGGFIGYRAGQINGKRGHETEETEDESDEPDR